MEITIRKMYDAKMHFGHRARFWNPKMQPYIYGKFGKRNKIHIIDLDQSLPLFKKALSYVHDLAAKGGTIMLVSTRRVTAELIENEARRCEMPYVNYRWLGGTLTNFATVHKSVGTYQQMIAREERGELERVSKKEAVDIRRKMSKMKNTVGGICEMKRIPDALFIVDVGYEKNALNEAVTLGIPVVAIVDSNNSYEKVDYMIPGNDDAISAVTLYARAIADAVIEGRTLYKQGGMQEDEGNKVGNAGVQADGKESMSKASVAPTSDGKQQAKTQQSPKAKGEVKDEAKKPEATAATGEINATMVKTLREQTGAGMMQCKSALKEANGDMEEAVQILRKSGQAQAAKRAGRTAAEGCITVAFNDDKTVFAMVETNSETDFVARDDKFSAFSDKVSQAILTADTATNENINELKLSDGQSVEESRQELITQVGENIQVRRFVRAEVSGDHFVNYVHGQRIGVLVDVSGGDEEVAKDVALHIAASSPLCVTPEQIPVDILAKEKEIYESQAHESGKPEEIVAKIVDGKMRKFCDEMALLGQSFVKDPEQTIGAYLKKHKATVNAFWRYEVGEGLERDSD